MIVLIIITSEVFVRIVYSVPIIWNKSKKTHKYIILYHLVLYPDFDNICGMLFFL